MTMQVESFFHEATFTFTHVVYGGEDRHAAIIDPVLDFDYKSGRSSTASAEQIVAFVQDKGLITDWILETHAHADHLSAAPFVRKNLGGKIAIGEGIRVVQETFRDLFNLKDLDVDGRQFDYLFADGEEFRIGSVSGRVIATPGHTNDSVTYLIGNAAFIGDTLFAPDYGTARTDFPGGDAGRLYRSIMEILALPEETRLYLCHDYPPDSRSPQPCFTIGDQRANIHLAGNDEAAFIAMREARDRSLAVPDLIVPSVQVNIRAGCFPPAEDNGVQYLKVPVNLLGH